jgi:hypothetical protein
MNREEKLIAYADGELAADERRRIEASLFKDEQAREIVAAQRLLRREFSNAYDPALTEPVPDRLTRLLTSSRSNVVPLTRAANPVRRNWWQSAGAMAASLVGGILIGSQLLGGDALMDRNATASGELAQALDVQLASAQSPTAPVQVGISFSGPEGRPCRTFESETASGLACHSGEDWQLMLVAPAAQRSTSEYQQASSGTGMVMASAQELMVGEPMNAAEEKNARDAGWGRALKQ